MAVRDRPANGSEDAGVFGTAGILAEPAAGTAEGQCAAEGTNFPRYQLRLTELEM